MNRPDFDATSRGISAPSGPPALPRGLDGCADTLRAEVHPATPLSAQAACPLPGGLMLHADPAIRMDGHWQSPRGRILEIDARITVPGAWLALHLPLPAVAAGADLADVRWLSLIVRATAARACAIRPCIRSGLAPENGQTGPAFRDDFFARHILANALEVDDHQLIVPAQIPDMPRAAPWRELILFLPAATGFHLALHDLRLTAL